MARARKPLNPPSRRRPRRAERSFLGALASMPSARPGSLQGVEAIPGDLQMQVDVHVCLLDAMTDHLAIKRSDIEPDTIPSKFPIVADEGAWGICLSSFGERLHELRPVYAFYVHKPRYTTETIDSRFSDTVLFLKERIEALLLGEQK